MKTEEQTPAPDVGMKDLKFVAGYPTKETTRHPQRVMPLRAS